MRFSGILSYRGLSISLISSHLMKKSSHLMKKIFLFIATVPLLISSCNGPLGKRYSAKTFNHDLEQIRESNKVNDEDMDLMIKYVVISRLSGKDLEGQTYKDILDKVKDLHAANTSIISQQKNGELAKRQRLNKFLKVNLEQKGFSRIKNRDVLTFSLSFQNLGQKNISTIIGSISLNDLLEREIKKINILLDEEVRSGATFKKTYTINYDDNDESDRRVRSKELIDMRVEWNPEKIIFKDGKIAE